MNSDALTIVLMLVVAAASGLVGVFALMRKMTLASDAISHIALPGLGIAVLLEINPLIGGAAALLLGAILIWSIERKTEISTETIIGVMFSASLAIGSLITPQEELIEVLFGEARTPSLAGALVGMLAAFVVIVFIVRMKERLTLALVSEDLATVSGISVSRMNLWFLLIFALNIILGLQFLGVLLMGSLIIVPAAVARNLGTSLKNTLFISVAVAVCSVGAGYWLANAYALALGPVIISIAAALFFMSLFVAKRA
ncbi:MAG: metal ABC transporter permease [bacterium]|nr:metal ABC transporter permease [bacterium]